MVGVELYIIIYLIGWKGVLQNNFGGGVPYNIIWSLIDNVMLKYTYIQPYILYGVQLSDQIYCKVYLCCTIYICKRSSPPIIYNVMYTYIQPYILYISFNPKKQNNKKQNKTKTICYFFIINIYILIN